MMTNYYATAVRRFRGECYSARIDPGSSANQYHGSTTEAQQYGGKCYNARTDPIYIKKGVATATPRQLSLPPVVQFRATPSFRIFGVTKINSSFLVLDFVVLLNR